MLNFGGVDPQKTKTTLSFLFFEDTLTWDTAKANKAQFFFCHGVFIVLFNKKLTKREHQKKCFFVFYFIVWKVRASSTNKESLKFCSFLTTKITVNQENTIFGPETKTSKTFCFFGIWFSRGLSAPPCHYSYLSDSQFHCPCRYRGTAPEKEGFC